MAFDWLTWGIGPNREADQFASGWLQQASQCQLRERPDEPHPARPSDTLYNDDTLTKIQRIVAGDNSLSKQDSIAKNESDGIRRTLSIAGHAIEAPGAEPGLYIVATPIGNMADITIRALTTLAGVDVIFCEDSRISRRLLQRYNIRTVLQAYHDHNGDKVRPQILSRLKSGASVALISDAGTPLVSDPGFKLVRDALDAKFKVTTLPGASAPIAALAKSGLPSDRFLFAGFLPPKQAARRKVLEELSAIRTTLVFFEAGNRIAATLNDIQDTLGSREVAVTRELTKLYEELLRGTPGELADSIGKPKGEITLLVGPPTAGGKPDDAAIDDALMIALETMSVGKAASSVAKQLGISRQSLYGRAVRMRENTG